MSQKIPAPQMQTHIVQHRNRSEGKQQGCQRKCGAEPDVLEPQGANDAAGKEQYDECDEYLQLMPIGEHRRLARIGPGQVPIEQLAQFDTDVGDHAGHVRGADLGIRQLGDHGILQAHDETEHHDCCRHEQPFVVFEIAA
ncbi:hypothetical protein D3C72_1526850 [compost metagenome]